MERNDFLEEFVSIIRCVAEGYGKVGYLRRDKDTSIHRVLDNVGNDDNDTYSDPGEGYLSSETQELDTDSGGEA
jgi:hypothetical protein